LCHHRRCGNGRSAGQCRRWTRATTGYRCSYQRGLRFPLRRACIAVGYAQFLRRGSHCRQHRQWIRSRYRRRPNLKALKKHITIMASTNDQANKVKYGVLPNNHVLVELHVPNFQLIKEFYGKLGFDVVWERKPEGSKGYLVIQREKNILC